MTEVGNKRTIKDENGCSVSKTDSSIHFMLKVFDEVCNAYKLVIYFFYDNFGFESRKTNQSKESFLFLNVCSSLPYLYCYTD